jgi:hypothetical protein
MKNDHTTPQQTTQVRPINFHCDVKTSIEKAFKRRKDFISTFLQHTEYGSDEDL